ncbi:MAG: hypothetical protein QXQ54_06270 [Thermoplasmata archaeon]
MGAVSFDITLDEISKINFTYAKEQLERKHWSVESAFADYSNSSFSLIARKYGNSTQIPELNAFVTGSRNNTKFYTCFEILYYPTDSSRDDEGEQNQIVAFMRTAMEELATACNITLNWDLAHWTFNYGDWGI